jgi:hypothetical protein
MIFNVCTWGGLNFFNLDSCEIKIAGRDELMFNKLSIYAACFLFINLLTLAQCGSRRYVNDHMLPLLMCLNPDQQTLVFPL